MKYLWAKVPPFSSCNWHSRLCNHDTIMLNNIVFASQLKLATTEWHLLTMLATRSGVLASINKRAISHAACIQYTTYIYELWVGLRINYRHVQQLTNHMVLIVPGVSHTNLPHSGQRMDWDCRSINNVNGEFWAVTRTYHNSYKMPCTSFDISIH